MTLQAIPQPTGWRRWLPGLGSIGEGVRHSAFADSRAALTVWAVVVPQSLAYATLAGMPSVHGLYAAVGALIGAAVYRLLEFFIDTWFGETASFLLGVIFILLVLFVPYGIVGTWRIRRLEWQQGWQRLLRLFSESSRISTEEE